MAKPQDSTCGIVGLGYVGLTLAVNFDRAGYETIGYDIDDEKIAALQQHRDATGEYDEETIRESEITFTTDPAGFRRCDYVFVALPTPIDEFGTPDLSALEAACETVGRSISPDTVIVVESTVYPGATREVVRPAVTRGTSEQGEVPFRLGYSPERIVPGGENAFADVTKVVSAEDEATLHELGALYGSVIDADVHLSTSIEAAEAAKCLENVQRDVNIGLVNEFTLACHHIDLDLDPHDVLEIARTKWNFHDYRPGIVGGHCIPVDPHYLRHKFQEAGFDPRLLRAARSVNQQMAEHVKTLTVAALCEAKAARAVPVGSATTMDDVPAHGHLPDAVTDAEVLLLGFGYKPNVADVRNSGVEQIAASLSAVVRRVRGYDPFHDGERAIDSFDFDVQSRLTVDGVDALVLLAPHEELRNLDLETVAAEMNENPVFVDVEAAYDPTAATESGFTYRRL
jgi:UDP-N-acetyl-D-galactosamine dehydrogenase